jgi:hypothetical protein
MDMQRYPSMKKRKRYYGLNGLVVCFRKQGLARTGVSGPSPNFLPSCGWGSQCNEWRGEWCVELRWGDNLTSRLGVSDWSRRFCLNGPGLKSRSMYGNVHALLAQ